VGGGREGQLVQGEIGGRNLKAVADLRRRDGDADVLAGAVERGGADLNRVEGIAVRIGEAEIGRMEGVGGVLVGDDGGVGASRRVFDRVHVNGERVGRLVGVDPVFESAAVAARLELVPYATLFRSVGGGREGQLVQGEIGGRNLKAVADLRRRDG